MTQQRIALVTGANRGIGLAICTGLAAQGHCVLLGARDAAKGAAAARSIATAGRAVTSVVIDVDDKASVDRARDEIVGRFGRLDALVNNAGILVEQRGERFLDMRAAVLRQTLETNLIGPMHVTQALLPLMRRQQYGRIVNLSSLLGQLSSMGAGTPAYSISKAALNALTVLVAAEVKGTNIKVNTMSPGWVQTSMGGPGAPRTVEQGADTAIWLATLPDDGPSGGFFQDRKAVAW
jgi:NAD(P)-dependent dehydrogenase (short-subunit alcohol dehydrogenase family)